jgi:hypothetical protein
MAARNAAPLICTLLWRVPPVSPDRHHATFYILYYSADRRSEHNWPCVWFIAAKRHFWSVATYSRWPRHVRLSTDCVAKLVLH